MTQNSFVDIKHFKKLIYLVFNLVISCYATVIMADQSKQWQPSMLNNQQIKLSSSITHKDYRIYIAIPEQPAPKEGYPIIYLLDGHLTFSLTEQLAKQLSKQQTIKPAVIVAIDYFGQDKWLTLRAEDFTPPHNPVSTTDPVLKGEENGGGAKPFLQFINNELKPFIKQKYPINKQQQALFGHSYGGLFTLFSFFTEPDSFQYYYAASPSIWWDNKSILRELNNYLQAPHTSSTKPLQLMVSIGSLEQIAPVNSSVDRQQRLAKRSQVNNAQALIERLQAQPTSSLNITFTIFPEKNHIAVVPLAIEQALTNFFINPHVHVHN